MKNLYIKPLVIFIIFSCFIHSTNSQNIFDSVLNKNEKNNKREWINMLNNLSEEYRNKDRASSLKFAQLAYKEALTEKYKEAEALSLKNIGIIHFYKGNYDTAVTVYSESARIYKSVNDTTGRAACLNNIALVFQELGDYTKALNYYDSAQLMYVNIKDTLGIATVNLNKSEVNIFSGNIAEAFKLLAEAFKLFEKTNNQEGKMQVLNNRSYVWSLVENYDKAISDIKENIKIAKSINDKYSVVKGYGNLGLYYYYQEKNTEALNALDEAIALGNEDVDEYGMHNIYLTQSAIYIQQKEYNKSISILQKVLKYFQKIGNKRQECIALSGIGRNLLFLDQIDDAEEYFTKSLEISSQMSAKSEMQNNYYHLSLISAIKRDFDKADSLNFLYTQISSDLADAEEKIIEIQEFDDNFVIDKEKNKIGNIILIIVGIIFLSLIFLALKFIIRKKNK